MGRKVDLSKLTDEEAQHVLEVIQRDFDLRQKEEERLGDLKCKIEKESTKRELLADQSHLNQTHCIHCLHPFKFLVNSKRQCLDCKLYTCKSCSRYNKKERGWVCDPCRLASRVVKIGSLEWYYEHVRSRFKRFGSAKVMRSLHTRLQPEGKMSSGMLALHNTLWNAPAVNTHCNNRYGGEGTDAEEDDELLESADVQRYSLMRKTKRLLSVHPFDFELDSDYSVQSRRQSQVSLALYERDALQKLFPDDAGAVEGGSRRESMIAEADLATLFHRILQEQGQPVPEQEFSTKVRLMVNSRRKSLDKSTRAGSYWCHDPKPQYYADMDTSEEEAAAISKVPTYQTHHVKRRSRTSSQESVHSGGQISDLNKRMSAIEQLLNRLEEKIVPQQESPGQGKEEVDANLEEEKLRKKLGELAGNISDKGGSSEEEDEKRMQEREVVMSSSSEEIPTESQKRSSAAALSDITTEALRTINATERVLRESLGPQPGDSDGCRLTGENAKGLDAEYRTLEENVYMTAGKAYGLEKKLKDLEECARSRQSGTTDSELSELEDQIVSAAAQVQHTESEVMAPCLSPLLRACACAFVTVSPFEERRKHTSNSGAAYHQPSNKARPLRTKDFVFCLNGTLCLKTLLRPPTTQAGVQHGELFERNSQYRGSLTQRNPNGKNRRSDRAFAKPVMQMRS
uniref:Melanophilin n=1 Tax=Latimeria chalumnae TaxID=7897 RepID=H3AUF2_LATCH